MTPDTQLLDRLAEFECIARHFGSDPIVSVAGPNALAQYRLDGNDLLRIVGLARLGVKVEEAPQAIIRAGTVCNPSYTMQSSIAWTGVLEQLEGKRVRLVAVEDENA